MINNQILFEVLILILTNIILFIGFTLNKVCLLFKEFFSFLCSNLCTLEIGGGFILGYILFLEIFGITSIAIDFVIEDILKPRRLRMEKLKRLET